MFSRPVTFGVGGFVAGVAVGLALGSLFLSSSQPTLEQKGVHDSAKSKVWKIGLVGLGAISAYYVNAIHNNDQTQLVAVCDVRKPAKMDVYGTAKYYEDYKRMIDDVAVEIVIIATPPNSHVAIIEYAASKKKKILVEKPIATSTKDCQTALKAVIDNKTQLYFAYHSAFAPPYLKVKQLLQNYTKDGKDSITKFNVTFREDVRNYHHHASWIFKKPISGGGCLIDSGINAISSLEDSLGELVPTKVSVKSQPGFEVETEAEVDFVLERDRSVTGHMSMDWLWTGHEVRKFEYWLKSGRKVDFNNVDETVVDKFGDNEEVLKLNTREGVDEDRTPMAAEYENLLANALELFGKSPSKTFNTLSTGPFLTVMKCWDVYEHNT